MALQIANFRVDVDGGEGLTFPCVTLLNRRGGGAPVLLRWVFQRSLEVLLFRRTDGGSTGAIWKALNNTGLQSTSLLCDRKAVNNDVLLDPELQQIMAAFKASLQPGQHDPSALGRIRSCTLLPLATAAAVCRQYGRSPASMGFLRCFHQQVPTNWELQEEAEQDAADGFYDPILHDKLDEHGFEAEELTIAQELTQVPEFVDTADDETKLRSYALSPTASLKRQLAAFVAHRTATFSARRSGGAVQSVSAEANCYGLLRFLGWMQKTNQVPAGATLDIDFLARADLGTKAQQWAQWLQQTQQIRFTSICNYLSSLVSMANYVYFELAVAEEVLGMSPNPLEQLVNLRDQAHGAIKEQNLYTPANVKGGLITWPQAQETRVKVLSAVTARPPTATLKEAAMVSLMTLIPPDRVGVIRRLRFQHTLKRRESCWVVDLSKRGDGHKTSKHYGPFHGELPTTLNGVLDSYRDLLAFEPGGGEAYMFSPNDCLDRPLESSAWTAAVKRMFQKHFGQEISPKALRSSFITWLRDSTTCPEVLKSAAHAQKHSERRQASDSYDTERDTRLCKAAFDFNSNFCSSFEMPAVALPARESPARATRGSSSSGLRTTPLASAMASGLLGLKCNHDDCDPDAGEALHVCGCEKAYHFSCAIKAGCDRENPLCALCFSCQGGQGSSVNLAAPRIRADPPPPAPAAEGAPPSANPVVRRCVFAACQSDTPSEGLRECPCGTGPHHHFCAIAAGCEDDPSLCARCLNVPIFEPAIDHPAPPAEGGGDQGGDHQGGAAGGGALDDAAIAARLAALHCEWVDEEMQTELRGTAETQPLAVRALLDEMGADSCTLFLFPEGKRWDFQRSEYSGVLQMTSQMVGDDGWQQLEGGPWVARLMRPSRQPVAHATYRNFYVAINIDEDTPLLPSGQVRFPMVPGAPVEGIVCNVPPQWGSRCKQLVFPLKLSKNGCSANEVTINAVEYRAADVEGDGSDHLVETEEEEDDDDQPLGGSSSSVVPLADVPPTVFAPPRSPHANASCDSSSESSNARGHRRALGVLDAGSPSKAAWTGLVAPPAPVPAQADSSDNAASLAAHEPSLGAAGEEGAEAAEDEGGAEQPGGDEQQPAATAGEADVGAETEDEAEAEALEEEQAAMEEVEQQQDAEEELLPLPPPPAEAEPPQLWRSARKRKAKAIYGDNGELDGPASSFRSAPAARKASIDAVEEMGVPAFALPGETVWAMGLHCGVRKRFKAKVVKLRKLFPRIVVQYVATEDGGTHPLELPDPITAYLTMTDLAPNTPLPP